MQDEKQNQEQTKDKVTRAEEAIKRMEELEKSISEKVEKLEQLRSDQLLSGTAGIKPDMPPAKVETSKDYANKVMRGELNAQTKNS